MPDPTQNQNNAPVFDPNKPIDGQTSLLPGQTSDNAAGPVAFDPNKPIDQTTPNSSAPAGPKQPMTPKEWTEAHPNITGTVDAVTGGALSNAAEINSWLGEGGGRNAFHFLSHQLPRKMATALLAYMAPGLIPEEFGGAGIIGAGLRAVSRTAAAGVGGAAASGVDQALSGQNPLSREGAMKMATTGAVTGAVQGAGEVAEAGIKAAGLAAGQNLATPAEMAAKPAAGELAPARNISSEEVSKYAAEHGIELTPGQATNSVGAKLAQGLGERGVGSKPLHEALEASKSNLIGAIRDFQDRLDVTHTGMPNTQDVVGQEIQDMADTAKNRAWTAAKKAYAAVPGIDDASVDVTELRKAWGAKAANNAVVLENAPKAIKDALNQALSAGKDLGTPTPDGGKLPHLTFQDAVKLRSFFREMGEATRSDLPAQSQAYFRELTQDLDDAMETAAKKHGLDMLDSWRGANAQWKEYAQTFGDRNSPLYQIVDKYDPQKIVPTILGRKSVQDIDMLEKTGVDLASLKRQVVEDIAQRGFTVGKDGLGNYSDAFLRRLLGGSATKELYTQGELFRRMGLNLNPSGTGNIMMGEAQLTHPSRILPLSIAAKWSMPKPADKYLDPSSFAMAAKAFHAVTRAAQPVAATKTNEAQQPEQDDYVNVQAGDGSTFQIHKGDLDAAMARDPKLKVMQ